MIDTSDFKNGISIILEGTLYQIIEFQHIKPGKGGAFVRTKLKNIRTKAVLDKTFRAGEKVEDAYVNSKKIQYTYKDGNTFFFMDSQDYEEIAVSDDILGDNKKFIKEGLEVNSLWYKDQPIDIMLPPSVVFKIQHTEPGIKGDTAKAAFKPATIETGAIVHVPLFVDSGDSIRVDTRTGEYLERA
jgi:elongation factor P